MDENEQQTQPTYNNASRAKLLGGECSHQCTIPAALSPIPAGLSAFIQNQISPRLIHLRKLIKDWCVYKWIGK